MYLIRKIVLLHGNMLQIKMRAVIFDTKFGTKIVYSNKIVTKLLKSVNQASLYDIDRIVYYPWSENKK